MSHILQVGEIHADTIAPWPTNRGPFTGSDQQDSFPPPFLNDANNPTCITTTTPEHFTFGDLNQTPYSFNNDLMPSTMGGIDDTLGPFLNPASDVRSVTGSNYSYLNGGATSNPQSLPNCPVPSRATQKKDMKPSILQRRQGQGSNSKSNRPSRSTACVGDSIHTPPTPVSNPPMTLVPIVKRKRTSDDSEGTKSPVGPVGIAMPRSTKRVKSKQATQAEEDLAMFHFDPHKPIVVPFLDDVDHVESNDVISQPPGPLEANSISGFSSPLYVPQDDGLNEYLVENQDQLGNFSDPFPDNFGYGQYVTQYQDLQGEYPYTDDDKAPVALPLD